jgi:hypothetical protein
MLKRTSPRLLLKWCFSNMVLQKLYNSINIEQVAFILQQLLFLRPRPPPVLAKLEQRGHGSCDLRIHARFASVN